MIRSRRLILGVVLASGLLLGWAVPHASQAQTTFNINNGIVGNLRADCAVNGNCNWCDFIGLMIVLQKVILSLFGGLALIMLVWGGQGIITAAGNQEKISKAKGLITSTLLGVAIVLAAYFIINIVVGILVTPHGQPLSTNIFGNSWWQAQCAATQ